MHVLRGMLDGTRKVDNEYLRFLAGERTSRDEVRARSDLEQGLRAPLHLTTPLAGKANVQPNLTNQPTHLFPSTAPRGGPPNVPARPQYFVLTRSTHNIGQAQQKRCLVCLVYLVAPYLVYLVCLVCLLVPANAREPATEAYERQ